MLYIIDYIINWTISLINGILLFLIIKRFLPLRKENLLFNSIEIFLITIPTGMVIYPEEISGILGSLLALFILLLIFHRHSLFQKFSIIILIFPVTTAISYILQDMGTLIWLHGFNKNMSIPEQTILHTFTMMLRIPIWYAIYLCVKIWISHTVHDMTRHMWILIDLISLASFIGIITVIYKSTISTSYLAYPACFASLVTNLGCCYLCAYMSKTIRTEIQLETYQYRQAYYQEMEAGQLTIRRLRHDMKNHLDIISTLLQNQDYENAGKYLNELNQEFVTTTKAYCSNGTVNAVLNAKEQIAAHNNIDCKFQIDLQESPQIDDVDLCSLLANTLDNALEACLKIPESSKRFLSLKARCKNKYFSYEITNSKANEITENTGNYKTDKADKNLHGIGIGNVQRIVEKYSGNIQIDYSKDKFAIVILIRNNT